MKLGRRQPFVKAEQRTHKQHTGVPADHFVKPASKARVGKLLHRERARRAKEGT